MMRNRKKNTILTHSEMRSILGGTNKVKKQGPPVGIRGALALKVNQDLNTAIGKLHLHAVRPISGV